MPIKMGKYRHAKLNSAALLIHYVFPFLLLYVCVAVGLSDSFRSSSALCHMKNAFTGNDASTNSVCPKKILDLRNTIYLMYDVNPPEGFNLRRDVYIRLAVFVEQLQRRKNAYFNLRLVLPPWRRLYHWQSNHIRQENLPWSAFFDIESMRRFAPILDFPEFLEEISMFGLGETPYIGIDQVFQLLQFEEMFENGVFQDKFEFDENCPKEQYLYGYILQQPLLFEKNFSCVRFQGSANMLEGILRQTLNQLPKDDVKVFALLNAEIVLHDRWGDREFWKARRSMRFAEPLVAIANAFRLRKFNSTDIYDNVQRPPMWEMETNYRAAVGGNYLCAHLRRRDFIYGREQTTPTLKSTATQIKRKMEMLNLTKVFLATDAAAFEMTNLKSYLQRILVVRFAAESLTQKVIIKDGGIAIIDQLICAHSRYFIGTYESTFTYRIYEEREILGFSKKSTFNTFCKNENMENCVVNSVWPVVY